MSFVPSSPYLLVAFTQDPNEVFSFCALCGSTGTEHAGFAQKPAKWNIYLAWFGEDTVSLDDA